MIKYILSSFLLLYCVIIIFAAKDEDETPSTTLDPIINKTFTQGCIHRSTILKTNKCLNEMETLIVNGDWKLAYPAIYSPNDYISDFDDHLPINISCPSEDKFEQLILWCRQQGKKNYENCRYDDDSLYDLRRILFRMLRRHFRYDENVYNDWTLTYEDTTKVTRSQKLPLMDIVLISGGVICALLILGLLVFVCFGCCCAASNGSRQGRLIKLGSGRKSTRTSGGGGKRKSARKSGRASKKSKKAKSGSAQSKSRKSADKKNG